MELIIKKFLAILDMKSANRANNFFFQTSMKNKNTHFNISVAVKCSKDDKCVSSSYVKKETNITAQGLCEFSKFY